ncbi:hypothetical protein SB717_35110, partial [Priestia sp. SIMBA_032]|uniref:hypothetical protein n=1 Tax=Priestia sp. SIMBA_032 TaxID=3085775 RepID=UPI00397AEAA8
MDHRRRIVQVGRCELPTVDRPNTIHCRELGVEPDDDRAPTRSHRSHRGEFPECDFTARERVGGA